MQGRVACGRQVEVAVSEVMVALVLRVTRWLLSGVRAIWEGGGSRGVWEGGGGGGGGSCSVGGLTRGPAAGRLGLGSAPQGLKVHHAIRHVPAAKRGSKSALCMRPWRAWGPLFTCCVTRTGCRHPLLTPRQS